MYQVRILDKNRKLRAVLPGVLWTAERAINAATPIEVHIPRTVVDECVPAGHSLHEFFNTKDKLKYAEIAAFVQIVKGDSVKATGKITGRALGQIITVFVSTEEILMESNITPTQYGAVWDGWDLADVARDLLDNWRGLRVKDQTQWQSRMVASSNVDLTTDPGKVMLAKRSNGRYYDSGYITLKFDKSEIADFLRWDRFRWSADSDGASNPDAVVYTTIQTSTNGTSFSSPFDGGLPEEVGYAVPGTSDSVWVRINLHTNDTESPDPEDNPVGYSPTVFSCELLARTPGDLVAGNIPSAAGVTVQGLSADHSTALKVLVDACEQAGWEFNVWDGALNLAESLGVDRTKDFVFRSGGNIEIASLGDGDEGLVNVLTAHGPGKGINRLQVTLTDDDSIRDYGAYPNREPVEFNVETLAELEQKAQEYLDEHSTPQMDFDITVLFEHGKEPDYGCGDKVRVADPDTGIITATRIVEETKEFAESGLTTHLKLGKPTFKLSEAIGRDGKDGKDGKNGKDGRPGADGKDGADGEDFIPPPPATPVWGDYTLSNVLTLTWLKAEHASGYEIRTDLNWGSADGLLYSGYAHSHSFIPLDRELILYIKALNVAGEYSEGYDILSISLPAPQAPQQPDVKEYFGTLKIRPVPLNSPSVQGYYIYVTKDTETEQIPILAGGEIAYPLESGTTVTIQVSAYDVLGEGAKSEPLQATTTALQDRDIPDDIITPSKLAEDLRSDIDLSKTQSAEAMSQIADLDDVVDGALTEIGNNRTRLTSAEGEISSAKSRLDEAESSLSIIDGKLTTQETKITNIEGELSSKVSQTDFDTLSGTVSSHGTTLTQHASAIEAKAEKSEVEDLGEDLSSVSNQVGTLTTSYDSISARVTGVEGVTDDLTGEVSDVKSRTGSLEVRAGNIEASVSAIEEDVDDHGNRLLTVENAVVEVLPGQIALKADASIVDEQGTRITTAEQQISALDGTITQTVARVDQSAILKPSGGELWHFDNSLDSTDGIKSLDGAVATLRPGEGVFNGAAAVEEGTENLLSGRWSKGNAIEIEPEEGFSIAAKFVIDVDDARVYKLTNADVNIPCQPNTFYTLSYYARVVRGKAALTTGTQIYIGSDTQGTIGVVNQQIHNDMDYEWKRFVVTGSTDADATRITRATFRLQSTREEIVEIEIADWQLEQKPFATSFTEGTRPDGILAYPISLADDYTIACYRKSHTDEDYRHIVKRSDGKVYVDGVEDSEYDVGWLGYDGDTLMLSNQTGLVDELLVLDYEATDEEIRGWYEAKKPFIDQDEINYHGSQIKQTADNIRHEILDLSDDLTGQISAVDQKADNINLALQDFENGVLNQFAEVNLSLNAITATVGDNESGLVGQMALLADQWTVKLNADGNVAGVGLAFDDDNTSEFAVVADKFSIATPHGGVTRTKTILEDTHLYIDDSTPYGHWDSLTLGGVHTHILLKTPEIPENATSLKLHLYGDLYDSSDDFILHFQCIAQDWNEDTANYNDFHNQYVGVKLDFPIAGDLEEGWRWYEFDVTPLLEVIKNNETYGIALTTTGLYEGMFYSKDYTNAEFHPYVEYIQPNVNVFTVTDGNVYLIGDMIAEGSILAEQLEADVMKTLLLQAELAIIDDADILKLDAQRIFVGDNIELGDNKVVVKGYPSTRLDITEDTYVEDSAGNNSNSDTVIFVPQVNVDLYTKVPLPKASHVVKAELHFYASSWGGTSGPPPTIKDFNVSACSSNWDYQTITGANRPTATSWTKRFQLSMTTSGWISLDITDLVNKWLSKELPNYGVRFHKSIETDFIMYAHSSRYADVSLRPHITFEYSEDNLATKAALGDLGGLPWLDGVLPHGEHSLYAIDAYLTGRFSVANGDKLLAELYKDELGGNLRVYNNEGEEMAGLGIILTGGNERTIFQIRDAGSTAVSVMNATKKLATLGIASESEPGEPVGHGFFMFATASGVSAYYDRPSTGSLRSGVCSGDYIGDGTSSRDIPLPFESTANLVIVWNSAFSEIFFIGRSQARNIVQDTGSTAAYTNTTGFRINGANWANASDVLYYYTAFN